MLGLRGADGTITTKYDFSHLAKAFSSKTNDSELRQGLGVLEEQVGEKPLKDCQHISSQVSYIGHDCEDIPDFLGDTYGQLARRLDLSFNQLRWAQIQTQIQAAKEQVGGPGRLALGCNNTCDTKM